MAAGTPVIIPTFQRANVEENEEEEESMSRSIIGHFPYAWAEPSHMATPYVSRLHNNHTFQWHITRRRYSHISAGWLGFSWPRLASARHFSFQLQRWADSASHGRCVCQLSDSAPHLSSFLDQWASRDMFSWHKVAQMSRWKQARSPKV